MDLCRSTSTRLAGTTGDLALAVRALTDKDAIRAAAPGCSPATPSLPWAAGC